MLFRSLRASAVAVLALALLLSSGERAVFAQAAGDAATIRAGHAAEDLGRLLDLARERGHDIVVRVEAPSSAAAAPAGASRGARIEA